MSPFLAREYQFLNDHVSDSLILIWLFGAAAQKADFYPGTNYGCISFGQSRDGVRIHYADATEATCNGNMKCNRRYRALGSSSTRRNNRRGKCKTYRLR
jgi:hypothetical protein